MTCVEKLSNICEQRYLYFPINFVQVAVLLVAEILLSNELIIYYIKMNSKVIDCLKKGISVDK
jgi:hypothetical protein